MVRPWMNHRFLSLLRRKTHAVSSQHVCELSKEAGEPGEELCKRCKVSENMLEQIVTSQGHLGEYIHIHTVHGKRVFT